MHRVDSFYFLSFNFFIYWIWHVPPGGDPEEDPGHAGVTMSFSWPGNALESSWKSWRKCPGRGKSGCPCSGSCPHDLARISGRKWMDGWIYWIYWIWLASYLLRVCELLVAREPPVGDPWCRGKYKHLPEGQIIWKGEKEKLHTKVASCLLN